MSLFAQGRLVTVYSQPVAPLPVDPMASGGGGVRAGGNQASMEHGGERNG